MGLLEALRGKSVYFDANIFIYHLENEPTYGSLIGNVLQALALGEFTAMTSHLTITELLPPLVKADKADVIEQTLAFLRDTGLFKLHPCDEAVCIQAGILRGTVGMKTPDAIHVATAALHGAKIFLTNDHGIRVPKGMKALILKDWL